MGALLFSELYKGVIHLLYPRTCEGCNRQLMPAESVLCIGCSTQLPETNYHTDDENETAIRIAGRVPFVRATSLAYFTEDSLLQHLMHGLKYRGKKENGTYLGNRLAASLIAINWLSDISMIIPVPLHPAKEAERGYNQSMIIANAINATTGIEAAANILVRTRETESQTKKTRTEREANMKGAFMIAAPEKIKDKHILLIDDVLTTGATMEACSAAITTIAGTKISIATIGIAVS